MLVSHRHRTRPLRFRPTLQRVLRAAVRAEFPPGAPGIGCPEFFKVEEGGSEASGEEGLRRGGHGPGCGEELFGGGRSAARARTRSESRACGEKIESAPFRELKTVQRTQSRSQGCPRKQAASQHQAQRIHRRGTTAIVKKGSHIARYIEGAQVPWSWTEKAQISSFRHQVKARAGAARGGWRVGPLGWESIKDPPRVKELPALDHVGASSQFTPRQTG